jgi:energy-converting hydrogenase Eha subunit H
MSFHREIISGRIADPGSILANDRTNVKLPLSIPSDFLMSIIRDISADWDIDYELNANLVIDIPIFGNFNLPLSKKGTIKLPTLSDIF